MAAPVVTLDYPRPARLGNTPAGVITGSINCSAYDTAHPAVTSITGRFQSGEFLRVTPDGVSTGGYAVTWDAATSSFKAYTAGGTLSNPTISTISGSTSDTLGLDGGAIATSAAVSGITGVIAGGFTGGTTVEVASGTNVGSFGFIAVGKMG